MLNPIFFASNEYKVFISIATFYCMYYINRVSILSENLIQKVSLLLFFSSNGNSHSRNQCNILLLLLERIRFSYDRKPGLRCQIP